jgi:hypothetical protein
MTDISTYAFHFREDLGCEIEGRVVEEVFIDLAVWKLVCWFMFAIVLHALLNGIVGEVDAFGYFF